MTMSLSLSLSLYLLYGHHSHKNSTSSSFLTKRSHHTSPQLHRQSLPNSPDIRYFTLNDFSNSFLLEQMMKMKKTLCNNGTYFFRRLQIHSNKTEPIEKQWGGKKLVPFGSKNQNKAKEDESCNMKTVSPLR